MLLQDNTITDFTVANSNTVANSFKIKEKVISKKEEDGTKSVEIMVPLKYLSNFLENSWNVFN